MAAASLVQLEHRARDAPGSGAADHARPPPEPPMHAAMSRRHHRTGPIALALVLLGPLLGSATAHAADAFELHEADASERWRARGVAFVDLPHGLRARYDAHALLALPSSPDLVGTLFEPPSAVPQRRNRVLESRFALSRVVAPRVEIELSWATRSPLSVVDLVRIEDQRVAAMIRFVP